MDTATKVCACCREELPLGDFGRVKERIYSYCRPCARIKANATYHRNIESGREQRRRWHAANKESVSKRKAADYAADREKFLARNQVWRDANPERVKSVNKRWYDNNKDAVAVMRERRRARMARVQVIPFTTEQLSERWAYYDNLCWMCGDPATSTDHVKPIAKGGAHMLSNLRPACRPCNSGKRDVWPYVPGVAGVRKVEAA